MMEIDKQLKIKVSVLILICTCPLFSSFNYRKQHPSMKLLAEPGLLPQLDKLFTRYGSMHTMREYIYWAIREDNISISLRKKLSCLLLEKTFVKKFLRNTISFERQLVSKYVVNLAQILFIWKENLNNTVSETKRILKVHKNKMFGLWAGSRDMYLSITGLLTIQKMYLRLPAIILKDISITTEYQTKLNYTQMAVIGTCSLFRGTYTFAVEWFEISEQFAKNIWKTTLSNRNTVIPIDLLVQMRDLSIQEHNKVARELDCWISYDCHMNLFTAPIRYSNDNAYLTRITRRTVLLPKYGRLGTSGLAEDQMINLCSGSQQNILPSRMQVSLKCYYEKSRHPYLYINPVKTEQISESPPIFQYYDILGSKLINELKAHYLENADLLTLLKQMEHYNGKNILEKLDPTPGYVIAITEMYQGHKIFTKFAEMVTGLRFDELAENLQFMDYTPGRGVKAHEDVNREITKEIDGNRLANVLYYLEIPSLGGYTPFCQAGVRTHLVKGSMVVWISKFRNGTNRNDVFHGACPVIHGNKLIVAQGLEYIGQENHFKCTLNQFE